MSEQKDIFLQKSEEIAFDLKHRAIIKFNMSKYDAAVDRGMKRYSNLDLAKTRASFVKSQAINHFYDHFQSEKMNTLISACAENRFRSSPEKLTVTMCSGQGVPICLHIGLMDSLSRFRTGTPVGQTVNLRTR